MHYRHLFIIVYANISSRTWPNHGQECSLPYRGFIYHSTKLAIKYEFTMFLTVNPPMCLKYCCFWCLSRAIKMVLHLLVYIYYIRYIFVHTMWHFCFLTRLEEVQVFRFECFYKKENLQVLYFNYLQILSVPRAERLI